MFECSPSSKFATTPLNAVATLVKWRSKSTKNCENILLCYK